MDRVRPLASTARARFSALAPLTKCLLFLFLLVNLFLLVALLYFSPARIAQFLYDRAQSLKSNPFGWLILFLLLLITSFPPLIGYSTCISLCGFAWGVPGFLLAAPATILGSLLAFLVLRHLLQSRFNIHRTENNGWKALHAVIKQRGLPLIILIRMSPFPPHVYSNALFASLLSVAWWQFLIATVFILPKILLTVFVASRIAALSDGESRSQMDTTSKLLNIPSAFVGILIGMSASWIVYRQMRKELARAEQEIVITDQDSDALLREPLLSAPDV